MQRKKNIVFVVCVGSLLLCMKLTGDFATRQPRTQNELPTIKQLYVQEVTLRPGNRKNRRGEQSGGQVGSHGMTDKSNAGTKGTVADKDKPSGLETNSEREAASSKQVLSNNRTLSHTHSLRNPLDRNKPSLSSGSEGSRENGNLHDDVSKSYEYGETSSETESDNEPENIEQKYDSRDGNETINFRNISENLYKLAPNVFDAVPEEFLPEFRNPCWWSQLPDAGTTSPQLKCLPYFFLAGMPKSGTTDVNDKLHTHPQVFRARVKEPHWWTRKRFTGMNLSWYIDYQSVNIAPQLVKGSDPSLIMGDSSASTFWDNSKWRQLFPHENVGPPHLIAEVIRTVLPKSKIIVTFRDPTARLFSDYNFFVSHDYELGPSIFHGKVVDYLGRFKSCLAKKRDNRTCAYDLQETTQARASIGLHSVYLRDWLKVFPRDQIKVIRLEDWRTNCTEMLPQLFEFLQLRKLSSTTIQKICRRHPSNVNKRPSKPMLPETKQLLREFYRPFNIELAQMLNDNKYLWEDSA